MFSSWVCDPAVGRPVAFEEGQPGNRPCRDVADYISTVPKLAGVIPAARLEVRPAPEMASSGILEMDALTGGLPRGRLTEVCGAASSGRTSILLAALAAATRRQEACALVDVSDAFDPASAAAAGMDFSRLLWVRCGGFSPQRHPSAVLRTGSDTEKTKKKFCGSEAMQEGHDFSRAESRSKFPRTSAPEGEMVEQALRAADLLLQSGGFGLVAIDLGGVSTKLARRIPLTSWFRFQRGVENMPTILFALTPAPCAQSCAALLLKVQSSAVSRRSSGELSTVSSQLSENLTHVQLLKGLQVEIEILRSRFAPERAVRDYTSPMGRKPAQSVTAEFTTKAVSAG